MILIKVRKKSNLTEEEQEIIRKEIETPYILVMERNKVRRIPKIQNLKKRGEIHKEIVETIKRVIYKTNKMENMKNHDFDSKIGGPS